jgi:hypothetical protein
MGVEESGAEAEAVRVAGVGGGAAAGAPCPALYARRVERHSLVRAALSDSWGRE